MASKRQPRKSLPKKKAHAKARKDARPGEPKRVDADTAVKWFRERRPLYLSLAKKVAGILEEVLKAEGIEYHSVDERAKELDSYEKKAKRYDDPTTQIHDLAGVRVIAYVESEASIVGDIVGDLFEVDPTLSEDKSLNLGVDKFGYRSDHYVATLGTNRSKLPEFRKFAGMRFEVQVRTILQHAWAEIEHDRNYKFTGVLPPEIQRRFALLAGALEMADREFDRIAADINAYSGEVAGKTAAGELDIPVDTISLRQYLMATFAGAVESGALLPVFGPNDDRAAQTVDEITRFGVSTLAEFAELIPADFDKRGPWVVVPGYVNFMSLARDILIIADADRYFQRSWVDRPWIGTTRMNADLWASYGLDPERISEEYGIEIEREGEG